MEPRALTLDEVFGRSVRENRDAVAVVDGSRACSYGRLDAHATAVARALAARGVGKGDRVAVYAERTVQAVAAILATTRLGAAFVPISLDTPPARLAFILEDSGSGLLLVDGAGREQLAGTDLGVATMVVAPFAAGDAEGAAPASPIAPGDLAYVIYTSGTTGRPKGVLIEHLAIAHRYHDFELRYELSGASCRVLQLAKLGFDVFLGDLVKALGSGGTLVLCPSDAVLDPAELHRWLVERAIDYVEVVPAVLRNLVEHLETAGEGLPTLRILNCGADLWTKEEYERCKRVTGVPRVFNSYGVTECTVESTSFEDDGAILSGKETLPIGLPLASDDVIVVDEDLQPLPVGAIGQICIGGPCVARGYHNRPELNERAFFLRAGRDGATTRFYETGDRGRIGSDGHVEFLGRLDFQIKIDGHRIEPGEVEAVLEAFPAVRQAVVCLLEDPPRLTALVRTEEGVVLDREGLAAHARRQLPQYMVPKRIVPVDRFPLTQNGKVDRLALAVDPPPEGVPGGASVRAELQGVGSLAELRRWLWGRGIELLSVVNEFVKPSTRAGVVVSGPFLPGVDAACTGLEVLVLLDGPGALKRRGQEVAGQAVRYPAPPAGCAARASLSLAGLAIGLDFAVGPGPGSWPGDILERLERGWVVQDPEVVASWRHACGLAGSAGAAPGRDGVLVER